MIDPLYGLGFKLNRIGANLIRLGQPSVFQPNSIGLFETGFEFKKEIFQDGIVLPLFIYRQRCF
jgi:hypothetical protein